MGRLESCAAKLKKRHEIKRDHGKKRKLRVHGIVESLNKHTNLILKSNSSQSAMVCTVHTQGSFINTSGDLGHSVTVIGYNTGCRRLVVVHVEERAVIMDMVSSGWGYA